MATGIICFEESQAVTNAFRNKGHEFYSCDLKECSGGHEEYHLRIDAIKAIFLKKWDFIGLHPVCTKLSVSGNRTYAQGKDKHYQRILAIEETIKIWKIATANSKYCYMENPIGAMNGNINLPKPQIIQPYYFGDKAQKTTCIWLNNLPKLLHVPEKTLFDEKTHVEKGEFFEWIDKKTGKTKRQPLWYAQAKGFGAKSKNKDYSEVRSKTFQGIANTMADQWSKII